MARRTLQSLIDEYGFPILTDKEVAWVHSDKCNWNSLEGEIVLRKCLKSFPAYLQAANFGYKITPYHYSMAANQQRDFQKGPNPGCEYGIILLAAPPQTGKSLTISESFPSWTAITNPRIRIICLGYSSDFARRFGQRNRDKVSKMGPRLTRGKVKIHDKIQSADNWEMMLLDEMARTYHSSNGGMVTTGMDGQTTGNTGNYVQIDDPFKNMQEAMSETIVVRNIELYQSAIETRLRANPGAMLCVMNTRWVTNDLHGWLRKHRKKYIVGDYNYAALTTEDNYQNDPLGREPNQGICPEMGLGDDWAFSVKESYEAGGQGSHVFRALYQGQPGNERGNLFKDEDWKSYEKKQWDTWVENNQFDRVYLSIDAAFKDLKTSDFVVFEIAGIKNGNHYIRYWVRKRMDLPDTVDKIIQICKKFPEIEVIYLEDKANGPGISQVIRKWRHRLGIPEKDFPSVYPIDPQGGKYSRAQTAAVYQQDGRSYILAEHDAHYASCPEDFEWDEEGISYTQAFKQEMGTFPFAGNDDIVDAYSQGIITNIPLLSGVEKATKKIQRFTRYSDWWPEMWTDYRKLSSDEQRKAFIRQHGAPREWAKFPHEGQGG